MNSRTGNSVRLLDNFLWKRYKKVARYKKYQLESREELKAIVKMIFQVIAEKLVTNEAGVFIRNFGYFFIWKIPNRNLRYSITQKGEDIKTKANFYTDNYMYSPIFVPDNTLKGWSMDNTFNNTLKQDLSKQLNAGKKYKTYIHTFKNLLQ